MDASDLIKTLRKALARRVPSTYVPWASRRFAWWLNPASQDPKREIAGVALVLGFYAVFLLAFWQYELHVWRPW
jgi:hypothetical protein